MRVFELMFFTRPDLGDDAIESKVSMAEGVIKNFDGRMGEIDKWGRRELAYEVENYREGFYIVMQFTCDPAGIKELERRLRLDDDVLRFMVLRIDKKLKKLDMTFEESEEK